MSCTLVWRLLTSALQLDPDIATDPATRPFTIFELYDAPDPVTRLLEPISAPLPPSICSLPNCTLFPLLTINGSRISSSDNGVDFVARPGASFSIGMSFQDSALIDMRSIYLPTLSHFPYTVVRHPSGAAPYWLSLIPAQSVGQYWRHQNIIAPQSCGPCPDGYYPRECFDPKLPICLPCNDCLSEFYNAKPCTQLPIRGPTCTPCTLCPFGTYPSVECTGNTTQDSVCLTDPYDPDDWWLNNAQWLVLSSLFVGIAGAFAVQKQCPQQHPLPSPHSEDNGRQPQEHDHDHDHVQAAKAFAPTMGREARGGALSSFLLLASVCAISLANETFIYAWLVNTARRYFPGGEATGTMPPLHQTVLVGVLIRTCMQFIFAPVLFACGNHADVVHVKDRSTSASPFFALALALFPRLYSWATLSPHSHSLAHTRSRSHSLHANTETPPFCLQPKTFCAMTAVYALTGQAGLLVAFMASLKLSAAHAPALVLEFLVLCTALGVDVVAVLSGLFPVGPPAFAAYEAAQRAPARGNMPTGCILAQSSANGALQDDAVTTGASKGITVPSAVTVNVASSVTTTAGVRPGVPHPVGHPASERHAAATSSSGSTQARTSSCAVASSGSPAINESASD